VYPPLYDGFDGDGGEGGLDGGGVLEGGVLGGVEVGGLAFPHVPARSQGGEYVGQVYVDPVDCPVARAEGLAAVVVVEDAHKLLG
jgi:hypothetical protein